MTTPMLDFTMSVLKGVSFDVNLFSKELDKACKVLMPYELEELARWLSNYILEYPELRHSVSIIR